ncbi:MAG: hypothetical protein PHP69_03155 [Candidatus Omnitrophica bacterium]|nr:hypothetical protein [Candidatus Omnitrophota bacterium]MDD5081221.1 hypothetical protein [Candidatus Omnitrophota bacterium]MDD5441549.1 hypothetical protein [Candidatus Omnitrophota bacterium]
MGVGKFKLSVMDPDKNIFDGEIESLFLQGDNGEYEIQPYHYPVLGLLREGQIIIDWKYSISIKKGILRFFKNDCVILVEMSE